jgi:hypothetical protein
VIQPRRAGIEYDESTRAGARPESRSLPRVRFGFAAIWTPEKPLTLGV